MTRELRRFAVIDKSGTPYTVIEKADFATIKGREVQCGASSFTTCTGWPVSVTAVSNEYWIDRLRLSVRCR